MFQRSPVLSGLLRYLVDETIQGRAGTLKSFIVAVDALGRKEDFDSASDSSARVQMGRLRKALEGYYKTNAPNDGACIYLLPGSYIVRLDSRDVAYPALPPLPSKTETGRGEAGLQAEGQIGTPPPALPLFRRAYILPVVILCAIALTAAAGYLSPSQSEVESIYRSPVLEIIPIDSSNDTEAKQTSRLIASLLADDLSRFKLSRVRLGMGTPLASAFGETGNVYRLYSRLVTDDDNKATLYLNIDDARTNVLIWSRILIMPLDSNKTQAALIPVMGEINGPQGIIASYESVQARSSDGGGYPCLLKYYEFARFHGEVLEKRLENCFDKPVLEPAIRGTMLGVRALFEVERTWSAQDPDAAFARGTVFAQAAVKADPNDGWANFAMARLSYLRQNCATARFYTERTMEANPNSPVFSAVLSGLAPICDYPYSERLLDQAIATQSPYFAKARLQLVLAAISQNRPEKISEIYEAELPLARDNRSNFYLAEAMIAASKGQTAEATRNWQLFAANAPKKSRTADDKLRNVIMIPAVRQQVIKYLNEAGVSTF